MPSPSTLARLWQGVVATLLFLAAAWFAWQWPSHPARAAAGLLAALCVPSLVLGVEFVLLRFVGRDDPAPRPTAGQLVRAWWGESVDAVRVFGWRQPFRWNEVPDELPATAHGRRGVVFIHGFVCNRGLWTPWLRRMGYLQVPFVAVNLEPVFASIDAYAPIIEDAVKRVTAATGEPPVLVCHSMGGLAARAWLRARAEAGGAVHHVVTIGTPHHGTWLGRFSRVPNGRQMRLQGGWLAQLARDEAAAAHRPPFTCWYSNCDNIVFPPSTATLPGADNRFVPGYAHVELAFAAQVMEETCGIVMSQGEFRTGTSGQSS